MPFVNYNGSLVDASAPLFTAGNRAFCYGDALFETIRMHRRKPLFAQDHFERLSKGMQLLHLNLKAGLQPETFSAMLSELAEKNSLPAGGRLRMQVFRNEGGYYISSSSEASFVMTTEALESERYVLNERGYTIDVFADACKTRDSLSALKSSNKLPFVLAGLHAKEKKLDECIMLNTEGKIAETINSNLFVVKNDRYYTPALDQGCIEGVMRRNLLRLLKKNGRQVYECILSPEDLLEAEEVFLTNVINGVRWVGAFRKKRYFSNVSRWLVEQLNADALRA
jgi:branched-subunit amino acid aminotransferase/4-amino-4-deoxychorismate lyase